MLETPSPVRRPTHALILASIVVAWTLLGVPRVGHVRSRADERARIALQLAQGELEAALAAYEREHGELPGRLPDAPLGTPRQGKLAAEQLLPWLPDGVPANPGTSSAHIRRVPAGEDALAITAPGWILDPRTGNLRAGRQESADGRFDG